MIQDLKFALRQLFKAPGFTIAAVIVLALGIGANTAVFSLVHTMFFAPPGYAKPHEVVQVFSQDKKNPKTYRGFSYPTFNDIRAQNEIFTDVMAYNLALVGLGQKGDTRRTFSAIVSSNYFSVLGVPLLRGRTFLPEGPKHSNRIGVLVGFSSRRRNSRTTLIAAEGPRSPSSGSSKVINATGPS